MLSRDPRHQSISVRKMYEYLSNESGYMSNHNGDGTSDRLTLPNRWKSNHELCNRAGSLSVVLSFGKCLQNGHRLLVFLILSLMFVFASCKSDNNQTDNQCAPGLNTGGRTWPKGDIILEVGQPLKIYCMLNDSLMDSKSRGKNASDLVFFRNDQKVDTQYVKIVNSTTSVLSFDDMSASEDMYYCKLRSNEQNTKYTGVCLNKVVVGYKPQEPFSFNCVSQNWDNITCTWNPRPNPITTHYLLVFNLSGRASRQSFACPKQRPLPNGSNPPPNSCTWDGASEPMYRQAYEYYTFGLNVGNVLGNATFTYKIHHFAHVIPSKPVNLTLSNKTYSSAMLKWEVPFPMQTFPPGLHHRVSYASAYEPEIWNSINITDRPREYTVNFNLTGLEYANTVYDIRVFMKSTKALGDDKWSKFSNITVKTAPTLPGQPPRTDVGSFEIADNSKGRDVYIYWQQIPSRLQNGDNFTYKIVGVEENGKRSDRQPSEIKEAYAKFKEITFERFKFEIVSANAIGDSREKATIYVPRSTEKPHEPSSFTKIAFDGGLYELSWNPTSDSKIVNYTIFWCEYDRDRPYQCNGYLNWTHVPRNTSVYNYTVPYPDRIYQFAISANTAVDSSGMVWASCTAIHNSTVGKMKSVWIHSITSDVIQVGWKLECSDRIDSIKGFVIYYCPIVSPYNLTCRSTKMNTTVTGGPHTMYGYVKGLKPYTTYWLAVAVLTKNGEGQYSDALYNTTMEAAPTPPRNVTVTNVTNTTITVEWEAPAAINGVLRYYTVYYNQNQTRVENMTTLQIQGLEPYADYNISVSASTGTEGNRSESIVRRAHIGIPGKPDLPKVTFTNSSQVHIRWNPPKHPGGNLDYYEIITADGYIHTNITTCKTECEKHLEIPDCSNVGRGKLYHFRVRAVNFGVNMERYVGPWSEAGEGNCFSTGPTNAAWVVIWIIGCLSGVAFVMFLGYSSKRIWIKCKAMQDVEVKLPPGLQPNVKLLGKGNDQHGQQLSADSSGCSSGQESVTSSLTSNSHVSTDSGADLDPVPMSPTKLLESPPTWESSSLRQRYVSGSTKPESSSDRGRWNPYVKVDKPTDASSDDSLSLAKSTPNLTDESLPSTAPGSYPVSQQHAWSSTGYISMPSLEQSSLSNPSPQSQSKGSAQGVYSVVGLAPSPFSRVSVEPESRSKERVHPKTADLIPLGPEVRKEPTPVNPYVSLDTLEQNPRMAGGKPQILNRDFADMEIVRQVREQQQQRHQQPPPYSISDKLSKPYVQTALLDKTNVLSPSKERDDPNSQKAHYGVSTMVEPSGGRPPFTPNFPELSNFSTQSLKESPSNTHVPVDVARSVPAARFGQENPYVSVSALVSPLDASLSNHQRTSTADDGSTPSNRFSRTLIETSNEMMQELADCDNSAVRAPTPGPTSPPVVKHMSGYVTIAENPTRTTDKSLLEGSSISYVPHQRANNKSLPPGHIQNSGQADEQYSKVTVVPTTT